MLDVNHMVHFIGYCTLEVQLKEHCAVKVYVLKVNDAKAIGPEVMLHGYLLSLNQHTTSPILALPKNVSMILA